MGTARFDANNSYIAFPQNNSAIRTTIYYSDTKAIAFTDNLNSSTNTSLPVI